MAATSSPDVFAPASACLMLFEVALHHSRGSCSDQSGRGVERLSGVVALLTTRPSRSMSSALAPVVERSIPRSSCLAILCFFVARLYPSTKFGLQIRPTRRIPIYARESQVYLILKGNPCFIADRVEC